MIPLLLIGGLFSLLALVLLSGDWRSGILLTIAIGFLQDPIRKLTPNQPGLFVGLALVAFVATSALVWQKRGGSLELSQMLRTAPYLKTLLSWFALLVMLQGFNGLVRWGIPMRTAVGIGFYLAPFLGLWMGFQIGKDQRFLRRMLAVYLVFCSLFAITAFVHYRGIDIPLFEAVGEVQIIHFRYGFFTTGAIGLWRTTDIAAWHLCAGAAIAVVLAFSGAKGSSRIGLLVLAGSLGLISLLTGRRKAITQLVVFLGIFLWLIARFGTGGTRRQLIGVVVMAAGLAGLMFLLDPAEFLFGDEFQEYTQRAGTSTNDLIHRFNVLGINGFVRGLEVSGGIGLGAGSLAQTGAGNVASISGISDRSVGYLTESGMGKIVAELGIPGVLLISLIAINLLRGILVGFRATKRLPTSTSSLQIGLAAFAISNLPFFSAAAGVYGDPFVLIICGLTLGSLFATPVLLLQEQSQKALRLPPSAQYVP